MFEVDLRSVRVGLVGALVSRRASRGMRYSRQLADWHPFPLVQLAALQVDALLVSAKLAAIEDVEDLVAFTAARVPSRRSAVAWASRWRPSSSFTSRWQPAAGDSPVST